MVLLGTAGLAGCSTGQPSAAAPGTGPTVLATPAPGEAQDPCTQLALSLLDGQLDAPPSADAQSTLRANEVVAQFVDRYDAVITGSGVPEARAQLGPEVAAACAERASAGPG